MTFLTMKFVLFIFSILYGIKNSYLAELCRLADVFCMMLRDFFMGVNTVINSSWVFFSGVLKDLEISCRVW